MNIRPFEYSLKQVDVVLRGRRTNDEQTFVKFDKALATGGVAGGVATGEKKTLLSSFSCMLRVPWSASSLVHLRFAFSPECFASAG